MRFYTDFCIKSHSLISIDFAFSTFDKNGWVDKTIDTNYSNTTFSYNNYSFVFDMILLIFFYKNEKYDNKNKNLLATRSH